ncbi:MAG0920 family protein [Mycoplasmopsis fermentans]|nr:hypothetical membrane spanning protein [Mycoplasmopsis fermentans JER]ADV35026.1 Hypothetical Protein MfeM64YM_1031 [Mycoplasmopsis fermentans M64]VEU60015.1 Uncharacterised protein [Mycoplasmopsis fermentans]
MIWLVIIICFITLMPLFIDSILVKQNTFKKILYFCLTVRPNCISNEIKLQDFVIKNQQKYQLFYMLGSLGWLLIEILIALLVGLLWKPNIKYYDSLAYYWIIFGGSTFLVICFILIQINIFVKTTKWLKFNNNLNDENLYEKKINSETNKTQFDFSLGQKYHYNSLPNEKSLVSFFFRSVDFYIKYPENFENLSPKKQRKLVYANSIFDFENTKPDKLTYFDINMFKDTFIKYQIIQNNKND